MPLSRRRFLRLTGVTGAACLAGCRGADPPPSPAAATGATVTATAGGGTSEADVLARIDTFLAAPDVNGAALLAIQMGEEGGERWVPHLVDMVRLVGEAEGGQQIRVALQRITGEYVLDDVQVAYVSYGGWMLQHRPDPGPGYDRWKQTLYGTVDPRFTSMLAQVADRFTLTELQWGGVTPDGIPPLVLPPRLPASEAVWALPDELVFGVVVEGIAVAYPERVLGYHELANDVIGATDVVVSYCPLCRAARANHAGGRGFSTSGLLRNANKVMVDDATASLWQQIDGTAFAGPSAGQALEPIPVRTATWQAWTATHPGSEVVAIPPAGVFPTTSYPYLPGDAYRSYDQGAELWFPVSPPPGDIAATATVVGLTGPGGAFAIDTAAVARLGSVTIDTPLGPLFVVADPTGALVYDVGADGQPGPEPRNVERLTWFAWFAAHPDTAWWPRA